MQLHQLYELTRPLRASNEMQFHQLYESYDLTRLLPNSCVKAVNASNETQFH